MFQEGAVYFRDSYEAVAVSIGIAKSSRGHKSGKRIVVFPKIISNMPNGYESNIILFSSVRKTPLAVVKPIVRHGHRLR